MVGCGHEIYAGKAMALSVDLTAAGVQPARRGDTTRRNAARGRAINQPL